MALAGSGQYTYEMSTEDWGAMPDGWSLKEATAVAVDSSDNVYVFNRGEHPVIVFDSDGQLPALLGRGRVHAAARGGRRARTTASTASTRATTRSGSSRRRVSC